MRLPDAIGIGARRCATSWLHGCLNEHPEIGKPVNGLHYFSKRRHEGIKWYAKQLEGYSSRRLLLEFSVSYTYPEYYREAARHIAEAVPGAKLFMSVRNPSDRAFSDYRRSVSLLEIDKSVSFAEALEKYPVLLYRGLYGEILEWYRKFFRADQIKVLFYEDLEASPSEYMSSLVNFLGVDSVLPLRHITTRGETTKVPRWVTYNKVIFAAKKAMERVFRELGSDDAWEGIRKRFMRLYQGLLSINYQDQEIEDSVRKALRKYYEEDIHKLEDLTGRRLEYWRQN